MDAVVASFQGIAVVLCIGLAVFGARLADRPPTKRRAARIRRMP